MIEQFEDRLVPTTVALSIPTNLAASQGATIQVPINVNDLFDDVTGVDAGFAPQSGMLGATVVLWYNPKVFSVDPIKDLSLGTLGNPSIPGDGYSPAIPNGWEIIGNTQAPLGQVVLGIIDNSTTTLTGTGGGSLAVINFHVLSNASLGPTMIDLAADAFSQNAPFTSIADGVDPFGGGIPYTLTPAPQQAKLTSPWLLFKGQKAIDGDRRLTS
jgi:hypothetical protein